MNKEEEQMIRQYQLALDQEKTKTTQLANAATSIFETSKDSTLVEVQLDLKEIIDKIYHLLRSDVIVKDAKGNLRYEQAKDRRLRVLSEYGVQMIMNVIQSYLNKNTILSNYDIKVINERLCDIGNEIADLIACESELFFYSTGYDELALELGYKLENEVPVETHLKIRNMQHDEVREKLKKYSILVIRIVHMIESAYRRALGGGENKSLRKNYMVTQSGGLQGESNYPQMPQKKMSLLRPTTWRV